ncbi:MaoC/PaaZ C-terminal domain-containing protein [Pontibacillus salipaludis]|uniref:MaoC/PaaZ C-terminal domain-containing protein n=1 Tax=Pontibacillus salipaludis TaxID=1697394 RepID=UPI0031E674E3
MEILLGKRRKLGKKIGDVTVGEEYSKTMSIEDKDILLYLGLTNDANPLYIQHDYASQTPYKRPLVPSVMLYGMVSSLVSSHLPGPGSHITEQVLQYPTPLHHYSEVTLTIKVLEVNNAQHQISLSVNGMNEAGEEVITGTVQVTPAYEPESMTARSLENFY